MISIFTFLNIQNEPYDGTNAHSACYWCTIRLLRLFLYLITRLRLNDTTTSSASLGKLSASLLYFNKHCKCCIILI